MLFEGQLLPNKKTRGRFERYLDGLQTPVGLPLSIRAIHTPCPPGWTWISGDPSGCASIVTVSTGDGANTMARGLG